MSVSKETRGAVIMLVPAGHCDVPAYVLISWRGAETCPPTYLAAFLEGQYRTIRKHLPGNLNN